MNELKHRLCYLELEKDIIVWRLRVLDMRKRCPAIPKIIQKGVLWPISIGVAVKNGIRYYLKMGMPFSSTMHLCNSDVQKAINELDELID